MGAQGTRAARGTEAVIWRNATDQSPAGLGRLESGAPAGLGTLFVLPLMFNVQRGSSAAVLGSVSDPGCVSAPMCLV